MFDFLIFFLHFLLEKVVFVSYFFCLPGYSNNYSILKRKEKKTKWNINLSIIFCIPPTGLEPVCEKFACDFKSQVSTIPPQRLCVIRIRIKINYVNLSFFYKSEKVGFEPTVTHVTLVFKTRTLNHSDTSPFK